AARPELPRASGSGLSILITSAPRSASSRPQNGPASAIVQSRTRMPLSGPGMGRDCSRAPCGRLPPGGEHGRIARRRRDVKITSIVTEEFRWPRHKPISNGLHTYTHSGLSLVKIETDAGVTGIGLGGGGLIGRSTIEHLKKE